MTAVQAAWKTPESRLPDERRKASAPIARRAPHPQMRLQ
jgi:hypothetical protein